MFQRLKDKIRAKILTINVAHLYNTIGEDDIIKRVGTSWTLRGKEISDAKMKLLIAEAEIFLKSELWRELKNDIKYRANKKMFEESTGIMDITMGKMWLYTLDTIETRLKKLTK